jgi:hypothetical protein
MPFAFTAMAYASFAKGINQQISPLIPALQSNWLIAHVMTCFIGYGAFAGAGGLGMMYLLKQSAVNRGLSENTLTGGLPELKVIDDLTHKTIVFGFMWLSAGIITGAVWANEAWAPTGAGIPRKPGQLLPGLSMPPPCTPALPGAGTDPGLPGWPLSVLYRSFSPILASTSCCRACTVTAQADPLFTKFSGPAGSPLQGLFYSCKSHEL